MNVCTCMNRKKLQPHFYILLCFLYCILRKKCKKVVNLGEVIDVFVKIRHNALNTKSSFLNISLYNLLVRIRYLVVKCKCYVKFEDSKRKIGCYIKKEAVH